MLMQARPGMHTLRTICTRKHLRLLQPQSNPSLYFSRFIHSTNHQQSTSVPVGIKGWRISNSDKPSSEPEENPDDDTTKTESISSSHRTPNSDEEADLKPSAKRLSVKGGSKKPVVKGLRNSISDKRSSEPEENPNDDTTVTESISSYDADEEAGSRVKSYAMRLSGQIQKGGSSRLMKKPVTTYVCSKCGKSGGQWWGICPSCKKRNSMELLVDGNASVSKVSRVSSGYSKGTWLSQHSSDIQPLRLTDVNNEMKVDWRFPLSGELGNEVARVLGGGLVPGSLILVGGEPGVGKSTLMLQIAAMISEGDGVGEPAPVVYVSGEESVQQIGNRADRLGIRTDQLFLYSSTEVQDILIKTEALSPRALIVDSIQTVYHKDVVGTAGGPNQVKECTSVLLRFAKDKSVPVLLTGHVNKAGDITGPRVLEHIVDTVLYMEGDKHTSHRLLRTAKNRFGSSDELGVLRMSHSGLQPVSNPSEIYLSETHEDSNRLAGLAVAVIIYASQSFVIEIQALCVGSTSSTKNEVNGVLHSRASMIVAVLTEQVGLKFNENGIFINVVGGYKLQDTGGDLAMAAAIASSLLGSPIPKGVAFISEIGLSGELRSVSRMEKRVNTVAQMGYKMCIVPKSSVKSISADIMDGPMRVIGCSNLKEVIDNDEIFKKN